MDVISLCLLTITVMMAFHLINKLNHHIRMPLNCLIRRWHNSTQLMTQSKDNVRRPRIYTRTGDNGTSALYSGERRPKDDHVFEALGTTDELSSAIGLAREFISYKDINDELERIQCIIQELQSAIATPKDSHESKLEKTKWDINHLIDLESITDERTQQLPPLKNFILPSGGRGSTSLHLARAICRRAERRLIPLLDDGLELPILQYLNRLSSYLFVAARVCAIRDGRDENIYRRPIRKDSSSDE